jgi:nicotinamide N-methyltransferase
MISTVPQSQEDVACGSLPLQLHTQQRSSVESKCDSDTAEDDPEDILSDSLHILYGYQPITLTSAGSLYTYTHPTAPQTTVTVRTPDPEAANWSLHASSVWIAAAQLVHNIDLLRLDELSHSMGANLGGRRDIRILELGAAAGLPSILIAKLYPDFKIIATDYPDPQIIHTLEHNIKHNGVEVNCHAVPLAWGSDPDLFFQRLSPADDYGHHTSCNQGFDVIIASDTLWNPTLHDIFISTLQMMLRGDSESRVYLVAGLHTGRYTIQSFLRTAGEAGFRIVQVIEREVCSGRGSQGFDTTKAKAREWDVTRAELEEEKDRRGWIIWIELAWEECGKVCFTSSQLADRKKG